MHYKRVYLDAIGYELAPVVVTTTELESRLAPAYERLRLPMGQLETLTGIAERRWWEPNFPVSEGAIRAARKALHGSNVTAGDIGVLVTDGSCRRDRRRQLVGGTAQAAPQHYNLCRWGLQSVLPGGVVNMLPTSVGQLAGGAASMLKSGFDFGMRNLVTPFMATDAA